MSATLAGQTTITTELPEPKYNNYYHELLAEELRKHKVTTGELTAAKAEIERLNAQIVSERNAFVASIKSFETSTTEQIKERETLGQVLELINLRNQKSEIAA